MPRRMWNAVKIKIRKIEIAKTKRRREKIKKGREIRRKGK